MSITPDVFAADFARRKRGQNKRTQQPRWCGIDPGKRGYVVVVTGDDVTHSWQIPVDDDNKYDQLAVRDIVMELASLDLALITLEAQQPTRLRGSQAGAANNAVRASFMTGYGFALWEMAFAMAGLSGLYRLAWPSAWKKKMGITAPSGMDQKAREKLVKKLAVQEAHRLFPGHDFRRTPRCQPSPDKSEAALLAVYGRDRYGDLRAS